MTLPVLSEESQQDEQKETKPKEYSESKATKGTETLVLKSVTVWINKPHVVNRRLCGARILLAQRFSTQDDAEKAIEKLKTDAQTNGSLYKSANSDFNDLSEEKENFVILLRELIPKSEHFPNIVELIVYDKQNKCVKFIPIKRPGESESGSSKKPTEELEYCLQFRQTDDSSSPAWSQINEIVLTWSEDADDDLKEVPRQVTSKWLKTVLLDKLVSWSHINDISTSVTSLQLVSVDQYKETYVRLKNTYGRDLVKNWPERTDPKKFVYEDIAIAAYLLVIWEEERKKNKSEHKQSFVDLGCGNGLLVYILTKEGHRGLGIDLRKRNIWDMFGADVDLQIKAITPSGTHVFPDYDWLIGNHSDELTPWIPVFAARSSYQCKFFVLPCCHHDFVGKFSNHVKGKSQYGAYLDYVKEIIYKCGFHPESDTLRIPSTKRICFIGRQRSYKEAMEKTVDIDRQSYIDKCIQLRQDSMLKKAKLAFPFVTDKDAMITFQNENSSYENSDIGIYSRHTETHNSMLSSQISQTDSGLGSLPESFESESFSEQPPDMEIESTKTSSTETGERSSSSPVTVEEIEADPVPHKRMKLNPTESDDVESATKWAPEFKPRVEPGIRNCQRVPEKIKKQIVDMVFQKVLTYDPSAKADIGGGRSWRKGGAVPLKDVSSSLDGPTLKELKSECGGLQTLLRNHSHIFQVTGGVVQLRDLTLADPWKGRKPRKYGNQKEKDKKKTALCWFHHNHPDGCPRQSLNCNFAHGVNELRVVC